MKINPNYLFFCLLVFLAARPEARAIPAYPFPVAVAQPDGSRVTLRQHGDEFANFLTTDDGYTVVRNARNFYVYATLREGKLSPTDYVAKDKSLRTAAETVFLSRTGRYLYASDPATARLQKSVNRNYFPNGLLRKSPVFDYSKFKGLIILVEFSDRKFEKEDARSRFTAMVNQPDYSDEGSTGSVRDYFFENSSGRFTPSFDVAGPVRIDFRQADARQTTNAHQLVMAACRAADEQIDFKNYDPDGNNQVDMVYFIFAGAGSNFAGNNTNYLWPHASTLPAGFMLDGVTIGRYACSTELNGLEESHIQDGIGTIVHEFSHVLGLQDYYDTDYSGSGGESIHPNTWSVMASGSYFNKSKTPCGFSLYERYALGWATPEVINRNDTYSMRALDSSHEGFRINSIVDKEFFLLENRQQHKWDEYLPGHGMLVYRVDSTLADVWTSNKINVDPKHLYYELIRAQKTLVDKNVIDAATDPFPGSGNITSLTNQTSPSISSWSGLHTQMVLTDIEESDEGVIRFTAQKDEEQMFTEDFEEMEITTGTVRNIQGKFSKWDFTKAQIQAPGTDKANGLQSAGISKGGEIKTTTPVEKKINSAAFRIWNSTSATATVRLYYSVNNGVSWIPATSSSGSVLVNLAAGEDTYALFKISSDQPTVYKINRSSGGSPAEEMIYIDDFTLRHNDNTSPQSVTGTETEEVLQLIQDGAHIAVKSKKNTVISLFTINGILIKSQQPEYSRSEFNLPQRGIYIIRQDENTLKIIY